MCGIAGYYNGSNQSELLNACDAIAHRGPDDSGLYADSTAILGLGHRRLSILDLSDTGHQPMLSVDEKVAMVFNGEIYNFLDLRDELENKGVVFNGRSDTEVLLQLYLMEGESMLPRLNGIFALAIWDRNTEGLLLARDGLGVKPLYYSATQTGFSFASELKALRHMVSSDRVVNVAALQRHLTFLWCPGEGTALQHVNKVRPGEALAVKGGQIERRWNWYRLPVFRPEPKPALDQTAAIEGTREYLRNAVRRQMVADVPVGAFLSGGLDSSAIVALAREQNPDIRCFTIEARGGQEAGATDDLPYARRVAEHLGVALDVVRIDAGRMAGDLERMVAQLDEPLADPAPLNVLYISQLAREHGIKVLLSGAGGDDLFTGYRRHRALMAEPWWSWLPGPMRQGLARATGALDQRSALGRRLAKLFSGAGLDGDARLVNYFRWTSRPALERLYSAEFRAALGESRAEAPMLEFLRELPPGTSRLDRMLALEQRFFLADHNLLYTDKMSMAAGVEVRVPFLDLDLVDFAARIPARFKQRGSQGKWALKKAMEPHLPREVIYRPKTGFGARAAGGSAIGGEPAAPWAVRSRCRAAVDRG
jgi:asparagine synthase (glutamine-hydrolysing)